MKVFFNYLLIFSVIFSTTGVVSASDVHSTPTVALKSDFEFNGEYEVQRELFELNGVKYFYEDTEKYTITISKGTEGEETIVFKDKTLSGDKIYIHSTVEKTKNINNLTSSIKISKNSINTLDSFDAKYFEILKIKILNNEFQLDEHSISEFYDDKTILKDNNMLSSSSTNKVSSAVNKIYGGQYVNRYLTSLSKSGYTGYLYGHKTHQINPIKTHSFKYLTTLVAVATALSTPPTTLLSMASWITTAGGVLSLLKSSSFVEWNVKIYMQKEVKVNTIYPYRAFYDRTFKAKTGPIGEAALSAPKTTHKSNDYDSNTSILNTGINNYIMINR